LRKGTITRRGSRAWLSGFKYRKSHVINGTTAGAQSNYPLRIVVHKGSGSDSGEDVYCNNNCRDDFGDIRFTKANKSSKLDYWLQTKVDGDYAVFWVETDEIPASPKTTIIYIYYGRATATSESNGKATFLDFDDFDDNVLDSGWIVDVASANETVAEVNQEIAFTHRKDAYCHIERDVNLPANLAVMVKLKTDGAYSEAVLPVAVGLYFGLYHWTAWKLVNGAGYSYDLLRHQDYGGGVSGDITGEWFDNVYIWLRIRHTTSRTYWDYSTDGKTWVAAFSLARSYTPLWTTIQKVIIGHGREISASSYPNPDWDNSYTTLGTSFTSHADEYVLMKHVTPEPTHGEWGSEEY
jgi:hypothetical protein